MFTLIVITAGIAVTLKSGILAEQLCVEGGFEEQANCLLRAEMLSAREVANISQVVLPDFQNTLSKRWQGYELHPFGSLAIGLGTKTSDVDYSLQFPHVDPSTVFGFMPELDLMLKEEPTLYTDISSVTMQTFSLYMLYHIPSQMNVDIMYQIGNLYSSESKIIKYYFNLDKRFLQLGGLLKLVMNTHMLTDKFGLCNHALYVMVVFYLQQKGMVPPAYVLQRDSNSIITDTWNMQIEEIPSSSTNTETVYQLLGGLFKYYSEFNFEENVIAPFVGRPVPRSAFVDLNNLPEEYTLYKSNLKHSKINETLHCPGLCIQNVFQHNYPVIEKLSNEHYTKIKTFIEFAARMYEEVPSDEFLRAIFSVDQNTNDIKHCQVDKENTKRK